MSRTYRGSKLEVARTIRRARLYRAAIRLLARVPEALDRGIARAVESRRQDERDGRTVLGRW